MALSCGVATLNILNSILILIQSVLLYFHSFCIPLSEWRIAYNSLLNLHMLLDADLGPV